MTNLSKNSSPISEAQIEQYNRDGYLLVSGLIPEDIATKAEAAMWRCAGIEPEEPPLLLGAYPRRNLSIQQCGSRQLLHPAMPRRSSRVDGGRPVYI